MPQRTTGLAATAVVLLLALTGCGGESTSGENPSAPPAAPTDSATEAPTAAPLQAAPEPTGVDAVYLAEIRKRTDIATIVQATDTQLIDAGHAACDALAQNPDIAALRLIEGEQPRDDGRYFESMVIGTHAAIHMCPEFDPR